MSPGPGGRIAGVVLAAGRSRRLGTNKLLATIGGEPLVRRAARHALKAGLDPAIVVVGHEAARTEAALDGLRCRSVFNPRHVEDGMTGSLRVGIAAVPARCLGALVALADMPRIDPGMMASLREAFRSSGAPLVVSRYGTVFAPPILYHRALFGELLESEAGACGKQVVRTHLHEAVILDWPADAVRDLDAPQDLDALGVRPAFPD